MFAVMPPTPPSFTFGRHGHAAHRPPVSSPLSSSPIRPPPPSPFSPCDPNTLNTFRPPPQRETQSSPIRAPSTSANSSGSGSKFRYATRNPRPNPVLKRREDAQEGRRRLFLQNVRQRADDKRWERRGGEDELLKLEWWRLNRERQLAREAEVAQYLALDADVDEQERELQLQGLLARREPGGGSDVDALMADAIEQQEEAEVDALLSALEMAESEGQRGLPGSPGSSHFSNDEDYDGIFMDLISQQNGQAICHSQDVEMS
ncbi:hypothetical protein VTK56DRAFT_9239 [Thermocarpiscus australiensis]